MLWNVGNLKLAHKDQFEITKVAMYLTTIYGENLTVSGFKIHYYLGVDLEYSELGMVKMSMIKFLQKVLDGFPEELKGKSDTPEADHLLKVRVEETEIVFGRISGGDVPSYHGTVLIRHHNVNK